MPDLATTRVPGPDWWADPAGLAAQLHAAASARMTAWLEALERDCALALALTPAHSWAALQVCWVDQDLDRPLIPPAVACSWAEEDWRG